MNPPLTGQSQIPDLSRVSYFDGQRLAALDLNAAGFVQRELRWLHNRSLHGWGIGFGFSVAGAKGDTQVGVGPGYAVDCLGREIVLTESLTRAVPARAQDANGKALVYYLVAAYPDDSKLDVIERRLGECDTAGAVRLRESAAIYWKSAADQSGENGLEIVLAKASIFNCQLATSLSLDQRRNARASQQPMLGAGATSPGATPWETWERPDGEFAGVKTFVDTSGARFGVAPVYQAQLRGSRFMEVDEQPLVVDGNAVVDDVRRGSFDLYVLLQPGAVLSGDNIVNPSDFSGNILEFAQTEWWVEWMGAEA